MRHTANIVLVLLPVFKKTTSLMIDIKIYIENKSHVDNTNNNIKSYNSTPRYLTFLDSAINR